MSGDSAIPYMYICLAVAAVLPTAAPRTLPLIPPRYCHGGYCETKGERRLSLPPCWIRRARGLLARYD